MGNMIGLEKEIKNVAIQRKLDPNWSVELNPSNSPEELATIRIYVKIEERIFERDLVIFKLIQLPLIENANRKQGFTIQWGFVPHPIIPIIHNWLKKVDTSLERVTHRNEVIKLELTEIAWHPSKMNYFFDGI